MKILLTGGAGYIGSHTCVELLNAGHKVVIYDNFSNSNPKVIERLKSLTGKSIPVIRDDIQNQQAIENAISENKCEAVIHLAGFKAIGESEAYPLKYYENNITGTIRLINAMKNKKINTLAFSSSATVYGTPEKLPIPENHPLSASNPYAQTKLIIENMLLDLYRSDSSWKIGILRYFNPVGAHHSGLIGESPQNIPNNLMPFISQVAVGKQKFLNVWGSNYNTPDGTAIRDYVHISDLARGHLNFLNFLNKPQCIAINFGTGKGHSVLEVIKTFEMVNGLTVPYKMSPRRSGDVAICFADPSLANDLLDWTVEFELNTMCKDSWNWQYNNPSGYDI